MQPIIFNMPSTLYAGTAASNAMVNERMIDQNARLTGQCNFQNQLLSTFIELDQSALFPRQTVKSENVWALSYLAPSTSLSYEENLLYLFDRDFDINIQPIREEEIKVRIGSIEKAKINI